MRDKSSVVIGGGLAGLASAALLAKAGQKVTLLEQSQEIGGRARTKEQQGFHLNLGPHALYRSGPGIQILRELDVPISGGRPKEAGGFAIRDGKAFTLPAGLRSLLATSLFGLADKLEAARILSTLPKIDWRSIEDEPLEDWFGRNIRHSRVKELLSAVFRVATYVNAPRRLSGGVAINQLQKALIHGVLYLDEGWQSLVDGLRRTAEGAGANILSSSRVASVEVGSAGQVTGVRCVDGKAIPADSVIAAISPRGLASLLGNTTSVSRSLDSLVVVKAACLDLALTRLPRPQARFALGVDKPLYFSVHSATARLAPEGGALIHVAKYLDPDDPRAEVNAEEELESLVDLMQPGWRDAVAFRRFLPDMIVMNGMPEAKTGGYRGRPGVTVADVPGLYLAGDWVGDEGLLVDASLASGKAAAEAVLGSEQIYFRKAV